VASLGDDGQGTQDAMPICVPQSLPRAVKDRKRGCICKLEARPFGGRQIGRVVGRSLGANLKLTAAPTNRQPNDSG
jgi:hypothetical protein